MKRIQAEWPTKPRTIESAKAAYAYAFILVALTVAQLFSFEKFIPLLESFNLPGGLAMGRLVAAILVVSGVLALPFLLQMKLSKGMRWMSMFLGWLVPAIWLFVTIWINTAAVGVSNVGLLGASVTLMPGWWAVFLVAGFGVMAAWASWGLWPGRRRPLEPKPKK